MAEDDRGDTHLATEDDDLDIPGGDTPTADEQLAAAKEAELKAAEDAAAGEDKAAEEKAAKAVAKDDDARIPKARFDEAVRKERERAERAEAQLREAAAKAKAAELDPEVVDAEIAALEEKVDKAVADGDKAAAADLRKQIRGKMQALATAEATKRSEYATAMAVERVKYDAAVATLETQYPELNPDDDKYSQETTDEMLELKAAYEASGLGSVDALKKAAKYVFKTAPAQAKKEIEDSPEAKDAKAKSDKAAAEQAAKDAEAKIAERRAAAAKKGLEARAAQPPANADKVGTASDKKGGGVDGKNVSKMTDRDFAKLEAEELARLRGDTL